MTRWRTELARASFTSVSDFCARGRPKGPEALNLIRTGAFDRLGGNRIEQFWRCLHASQDAAGAGWLYQGAAEADIRATLREEPAALQKLHDEIELFGYTVTGNPLELHPDIAWHCPSPTCTTTMASVSRSAASSSSAVAICSKTASP